MATSLFNLLNPKAIDGSIKPVEGVKTLSDKLGVPQAPITPVSTAMVGANQDQAKMAGTPAQTTSALKMGQEFATAERTQQPQVVQTPEQQIKLDQAKKWTEELGSLGDRVVSAVAGLGQNIPVQTGAVLNEEWLKSSGLDIATQAKVQPALAGYNAAIQSGDEATINKSIESLEAIVGKDKMGDLILSSNDPMAIGNWMAKQTPDAISVKMLRASNPDMFNSLFTGENSPYKSADEFAQDLGLKDASELDSMKLSDLQAKTSALVTKGQDETTRLKSVLSDNGASATDRSAARNRLRELGVVGIEASEQELTELADNIQKAGVINVNGISVDINELLEDEHFSAAIDAYLDGDREAGQALPPGIKSVVDANVGLFDQIAKEAAQKEAGWQELKANVDSFNKSLTDAEGKGLSDEAQKALYEAAGIDTSIPNWKEIYTTDKLAKVNSTPLVSILSQMNDPKNAANKAATISHINDIVKNGWQLNELLQFSPDELTTLGIIGDDPVAWAKTSDFLQKRKAIMESDDPLGALVGADTTSIANYTKESSLRKALKLPATTVGLGSLDANHDGNLTPDEIRAAYSDLSSVFKLAGADYKATDSSLSPLLTAFPTIPSVVSKLQADYGNSPLSVVLREAVLKSPAYLAGTATPLSVASLSSMLSPLLGRGDYTEAKRIFDSYNEKALDKQLMGSGTSLYDFSKIPLKDRLDRIDAWEKSGTYIPENYRNHVAGQYAGLVPPSGATPLTAADTGSNWSKQVPAYTRKSIADVIKLGPKIHEDEPTGVVASLNKRLGI